MSKADLCEHNSSLILLEMIALVGKGLILHYEVLSLYESMQDYFRCFTCCHGVLP